MRVLIPFAFTLVLLVPEQATARDLTVGACSTKKPCARHVTTKKLPLDEFVLLRHGYLALMISVRRAARSQGGEGAAH